MAATTETPDRAAQLQGLGASRLRKEDARFIRGQGTYIDDIKLPGMLFGAMVRSPYAHARITSIDKSKAAAAPGVVAVLTADDLKPVNLHWMPTVGGDVQAVHLLVGQHRLDVAADGGHPVQVHRLQVVSSEHGDDAGAGERLGLVDALDA